MTQECNLVRQINASFQRLRPSGTISTPQQQTTPLSNHGQMATFSLEISNNHYKGPAELGRFRGLPFSHHTSVDPIESIDDSTTSLPIIEAYKGEARHKQKKLAKPLSTPIHIANDQQLAPALLPLRPKRGTVAKKPESLTGNQRIIFLNHRYPEGQGPDTELIQTIERDIIETSPDVSLDSIAGLENAITILHETITLPALMPEFFNGIRRP